MAGRQRGRDSAQESFSEFSAQEQLWASAGENEQIEKRLQESNEKRRGNNAKTKDLTTAKRSVQVGWK